MAKQSVDDWSFKMLEKYDSQLRVFSWIIFYLLMTGYIGLFIKFGFNYGANAENSTLMTITSGILLSIICVLAYFAVHFAGGVDFDLKLLGLPIGLAIGGAVVGLIGGLYNSITGWTIGVLGGSLIILLTANIYWKKIKNT
jgi:hypothetical protein